MSFACEKVIIVVIKEGTVVDDTLRRIVSKVIT